jgi:hypothetical protein
MHTATLLIPFLAVLAQAQAAPETNDYASMPSAGEGQAQARALLRAAGKPVDASVYVLLLFCSML